MLTKECPHCGEVYTPKRSDQIYCSSRCRTAAFYIAHPDKKPKGAKEVATLLKKKSMEERDFYNFKREFDEYKHSQEKKLAELNKNIEILSNGHEKLIESMKTLLWAVGLDGKNTMEINGQKYEREKIVKKC